MCLYSPLHEVKLRDEFGEFCIRFYEIFAIDEQAAYSQCANSTRYQEAHFIDLINRVIHIYIRL
jgi:hypothetical protein